MSAHTKILGNAFAQFFGKLLTAVSSFFIVKLVTSLGADFYGRYVVAYEFLAFFGVLADAGLFAVAVREISRVDKALSSQNSPEFILGNILAVRLLLVSVVIFLAGISAQFIPNYSPELKLGIWITAISMGLTILAGTLSSVLQARMKIQKFSLSLVIGKIVLAVLIFLIIKNLNFFAGFNSFFILLWAGVISNIVFTGLVYYFVSREISINLLWDCKFIKHTLQSTISYGLALVLQTLYLRLDMVLISMILGMSASGIYGVSTRILESVLVLGVFFGQAVLPQISAQEKNTDKISQTLGWGIEKLLIIALPMIIGVWFFSREMILLLSSSQFISTATAVGSDTILKVLIFTVLFAFLNQLFTFTLVARNRQFKLVIINGLALLANGFLNIIFLKKYGILAAAISTVLCEILVFGLLFWEIKKYFRFKFSRKNMSLVFLANFIIWAELFMTPLGDNLFLAVIVCGITYFAVLAMNWREMINSPE